MTSTTPIENNGLIVGRIEFKEDMGLLRRSIAIEQARIEYLERELDAMKGFIKDYLSVHGLQDIMSKRANDLLKNEMCRMDKVHK